MNPSAQIFRIRASSRVEAKLNNLDKGNKVSSKVEINLNNQDNMSKARVLRKVNIKRVRLSKANIKKARPLSRANTSKRDNRNKKVNLSKREKLSLIKPKPTLILRHSLIQGCGFFMREIGDVGSGEHNPRDL